MCIRDSIIAKLNGIQSTVMIDTGSNISLIDSTELERIQRGNQIPIPTLPVNNIIIIGATGRQNKSVKKQVLLDLTNDNVTIPIGFLVATGLPFNVLIGCDILQQHSAVIDLSRGIVSLTSEEGVWTAELVDANRTVSVNAKCHVMKSYFCKNNKLPEVIKYEDDDQEL